MDCLISVIIPVYNVEPYLKKCIDSVLNQTWQKLEIILIDDGSTDKSGEICDIYAEKHDNIIVVHQSNQGLSVARNTGLDICTGEWVAFLDSDDWIEPEMYETLYRIAIKYDVSLSSCLSRDCYIDSKDHIYGDNSEIVLDYVAIINGLNIGNVMRFEVWNKLWKRDLIGNTRFVPGQVAEDVHFDRILFDKAQKIAHINKVFHNYLISRPGNTNSSFKLARLCIFEEFEMWKVQLEKEDRSTLANVISAIAANFAVDIFGNAIKAGQENKTLKEINSDFIKFYSSAIKSEMRKKRRSKLFLFKLNPKLSVYILDVISRAKL